MLSSLGEKVGGINVYKDKLYKGRDSTDSGLNFSGPLLLLLWYHSNCIDHLNLVRMKFSYRIVYDFLLNQHTCYYIYFVGKDVCYQVILLSQNTTSEKENKIH